MNSFHCHFITDLAFLFFKKIDESDDFFEYLKFLASCQSFLGYKLIGIVVSEVVFFDDLIELGPVGSVGSIDTC